MPRACFIGTVVLVAISTVSAQPNSYCITGFDWRTTNSRMVAIGMPGGRMDESGSLGYFWGKFNPYNIPAMTNPCYRWTHSNPDRIPPYHCYEVDTDTIRDPAAAEDWIAANPGHTYLIGNEMDNPDLNAGDGMIPEQYARQYHTYATFIRSIDPTAKIAVGGLYASGYTDDVDADILWWNQVLDYYRTQFGEEMPVDVWNCHCYTPVGDLDAERIVQDFFIPYRTFIDTVSGGIYADKPLWCTEYGIAQWATPLSPELQAAYIGQLCPRLEKEYLLPTGETKRVCDRFFWFLGPYSEAWRDSAMLDQSGDPTIVGTTYSALANNTPNAIPPAPPEPGSPPARVEVTFDTNPGSLQVVAGDWMMENGTYRQTRYNEKWGTYSQLPYWYDHFHAECDVKVNQAAEDIDWVGLYFGQYTIWRGLEQGRSVVYMRRNGSVGLAVPGDGIVKEIDAAVADASVFHRLAVTVTCDTCEVSIDGAPLFSWTDDQHRRVRGMVALAAGQTDCSFDNFVVERIGEFDADTDGDGIDDVCDQCADTPAGLAVGIYGCGLPIPGDLDGDFDVDQEDFGEFQACYSGPGLAVMPTCIGADLDGDDDADQSDFELFSACMTGADILGSADCLP